MTALPLDRRALQAIAARFTSRSPDEQLAALAHANSLLARAGTGWTELLKPPPEEELEQMVRQHPMRVVVRLLRRDDGLTPWEQRFLQGLHDYRVHSDKQIAILLQIARTVAEIDAA